MGLEARWAIGESGLIGTTRTRSGRGDVVRRRARDAAGAPTWGLVVTADCDIAQRKAGNRYTWLQIVTGEEYLRSRWVPEQLRRIVDKQGRQAAEGLSAQLKKLDPALSPLTSATLRRWLLEEEPGAVWAAVAPGKAEEPKLMRLMHAVRVAASEEPSRSAIDRLRDAWTLLGRSAADQATLVGDALKGDRGFPDYFLLPELPQADGYGFVILLREIASIDADAVFASELDARLADRPDGFHRIARLEDGVRFAITQKLAFLFSRIGMPTSFERACDAAADLLVHQAGFQEQAA